MAVCARGTINFSEKANKAAEAGAVAVLIYNNVPGALSMDLSEYWYEPPCVSLTQSDGQWMRDQGELHTETIEEDNWGEIVTREIQYYTGELTVAQNVSTVIYDEPYTMSDFSSWGVPGSLELKPEITAPGRQHLLRQRRDPRWGELRDHVRYLHGRSPDCRYGGSGVPVPEGNRTGRSGRPLPAAAEPEPPHVHGRSR